MSTGRAEARVNVAAIRRNCELLRRRLGEGTELCAVVKSGGYGHGAVAAARAAIAGGAGWLAVADAPEALELRDAGIGDVPILVMGALTEPEVAACVGAGCDVIVWSPRTLGAVAAAGGGRVHVKLDTGMGRLGTRDPLEASAVASEALEHPDIELAGLMTHFATADERSDAGFFDGQLARFLQWAVPIRQGNPAVMLHAANSAATLREPASHLDMVRCGIAVYGMDPFGEDPAGAGLEPALELISRVAEVKACLAGESAGYGRRFIAERDTHVAVVPAGYGDGWRRGLSGNADVLIAGRRFQLVGTVSMDSITVDVGSHPDPAALRGEPVILIGSAGAERITAEQVARRLGTINYEVTCALTPRVPRVHHSDGSPAAGAKAP